jgi:serine/threonine-protein kinase
MGEVYRARDTRLDRTVAIKVLRSRGVTDPDIQRRFEREAKAISALNHPNICTLFDVGRNQGLDFLVMEFLEGETLASLLERERLDERRIVDLGAQIADALAEAHVHGIVHRDVKPQNVIVTPRGLAKVLDFGLAKTLEAPRDRIDDALTASGFTQDGALLGTGPFMSPEQVKGEPLDPRTDAFSFGAVMYQMVCGRPPFLGATLPETLAAILSSEPPPLVRFAPWASAELQRIVRKCLEKDRTRRYQTLRDVAIDLENHRRELVHPGTGSMSGTWRARSLRRSAGGRRRLAVSALATLLVIAVAAVAAWRWPRTGSRAAADVRSLAVLPLRPLAGDPKENYLGLGVADAVITRISQARSLTVRPTSAVRRYATIDADALNAGKEQQVDAVLDGAWQRDGDRLRVSVNLLRVSDGASLWAQNFDVLGNDVFAIQDQLSENLVARLRLELGAARRDRPLQHGTQSADAYEAYIRGRFHFGERGFVAARRENSDTAIAMFQKAASLDPAYAEAHAMLGYAYAWTAVFIEEAPVLIQRAKDETTLAERLDPELGQPHLTRAFIAWSWYEGWRIADAIREIRKAQQLDPSLTDSDLPALYGHLGFFDEWREILERSIKLDPTNRNLKGTYVNDSFNFNLPEQGVALQQQLLGEGPDERYFLLSGRLAEAARIVEANAVGTSASPGSLKNLAVLRALQGRHPEAQALIPRILAAAQKNRSYHHFTYDIARVFALGGKTEEAVKWLNVTIRWGFPCYPMFAQDRFLDPIRSSSRFQTAMADLKKQWDQYRTELH